MKRLIFNIITAVFLAAVIFCSVITMENIFPFNKEYLSPLSDEEILTEQMEFSKLFEIAEINDSLILVNNNYPISKDYEPELVDLTGDGVYMNSSADEAYFNLKQAVKDKFNNNLYIMSVYRTPEEQEKIIRSGNEYAAKKYASEHLTGLAVDVYVKYHAGMGFIDTDEGKFVNKNCSDYGFIIRYPYYGEDITGITYEPWHLRYLGFPHAKIISKQKITLEEYIFSLKVGEFYSYENYVISRQKEAEYICLPTNLTEIVVSSDNTGCVIITGKY